MEFKSSIKIVNPKFLIVLLNEVKSHYFLNRIVFLNNMIYVGVLAGFSGLLTSIFLDNNEFLQISTFCFIFSLLSLIILRYSKSVQVAGTFFYSSWFIIMSYRFLFFDEIAHLALPFWLIIVNVSSAYVLGVLFSVFLLVASISIFVYYMNLYFVQDLQMLMSTPDNELYLSYLEVFAAIALLGFVLFLIIKNGVISDRELTKKNKELINQNQLIKASSDEKTVMLKEIHHRVKNNLQIIISLLRLQMDDLENDEAIGQFRESINRIVVMSTIHEKLYQSKSLNNIVPRVYFEELTLDVLRSYNSNKKIDCKVNIEVDLINLKTLVPLALLYQELLSNSIKHAFEDVDSPVITVEMTKNEKSKKLNFVYSDNGIWREDKAKSSLGLELINAFTEQLDGGMVVEYRPFTKYEFELNVIS